MCISAFLIVAGNYASSSIMNTVIKFSKIFFDFPDVEQRNIQPEWPGGGAPQLTDAIWILAAACWMKDSIQRPTVNTVRTTFSHISLPLLCQPVTPSQSLLLI